MTYYAHSAKDADPTHWQPLPEHLLNVARLAGCLAAPMGLKAPAFLAGLVHDFGKYAPAFQAYIKGKGRSVDHSTAGAALLLGRLPDQQLDFKIDATMARIIAACVAGHHAGLPDFKSDESSSLNSRLEKRLEPVSREWRHELVLQPTDLMPGPFKTHPPTPTDLPFALSVMGRMIFSALVDADFKDTEAFYAALENRQVARDWPDLQALLPDLQSRFDAYMASLGGGERTVNRLRHDILNHVRAQAHTTPGLFTLTVPTGGGKTLTSLAFALDHARAHGHRRIIYAIPFTSVIEQTAAIFRQVLGDEIILEHHSAIEEAKSSEDEPRHTNEVERQAMKLRQAREDWAAPVVVTTNVQLFESLFAARPSRARKLHNIAGSVIILDEAQTLPTNLLLPCMRMLEELAVRYGCSIVLCTATQPALDKKHLAGGLPLGGRELAPNPEDLARQLKRAHIWPVGSKDNEALLGALTAERQSLIIVNSRKHALDLFNAAQKAELDGLIHLTTRMCAAHRVRVLADIRARLQADAPCRVIATSLVEAGVDLDFPSVWRAEAGLDSLVQAAGRCNREGKRPLADSIVKVFQTPDYQPPDEIKSLIGDMARMAKDHGDDLASLDAIKAYFREVYWRLDAKGLDRQGILGCFSFSKTEGPDFAYQRAAKTFCMIKNGLVPVIVPFDDEAKRIIAQLNGEALRSGALARRLQRYVVQVPPKARALMVKNGRAVFAAPALRGEQFCVLQDESLYDPEAGLLWDNADYLSLEESLW